MSITGADWAGVTVILKDERRLGWKITRGEVPRSFNSRYYFGFSSKECSLESASFDDPSAFEKAREWVRQFEKHEAAGGNDP